ncbi:MAG: DUF488 domain-containing protein [Anaerolineales bacterium]|nr:DUF488 domain-containing protein [Anaerolineales bacterium]
MKVFTIGFTKTSAESFFTRLQKAGVKKLIDVRLNNVSQLAGFAKRDDLRYFLNTICGIEYAHLLELAPTQEMLDAYKKQKGQWADYEKQFLELMKNRRIEETITRAILDGACLLCSEKKPNYCHRRLVAEYLKSKWGDLDIVHL